ncbi:hypothetical protein FA13DRAFT_1743150 [Coprinellus micaceus]|nr:hypothetical protein FA13DRAFT_1743150 [Coprinellus micaceus]
MPTGCWIQEMVGAEQAKARTSRVDITEKQQSRLDNCRGPPRQRDNQGQEHGIPRKES